MFGSRSRSERFASWVLLAGIISCSVFLVIVFSRYRFFATTPRVVFLYVAPTLVLAMLAGSLALPPRHKVNMALSFSSVVVALYAVEIVLSLRTSPQIFAGVAEALGSTDRQTRLEVVTVSANLGDRLGAVVALDNLRGIFGRFDTPLESWGGELHLV